MIEGTRIQHIVVQHSSSSFLIIVMGLVWGMLIIRTLTKTDRAFVGYPERPGNVLTAAEAQHPPYSARSPPPAGVGALCQIIWVI